jgi:vacuolar-type H+-ATPase subunit C/Vma6
LGLAPPPREDLALALVRQSRFGEELGSLKNLDIDEAQRALDRHLVRFGHSYWQRDPLSVAPAIAYLSMKRVEVANVRSIAQGVALGLHRAEIERGVI